MDSTDLLSIVAGIIHAQRDIPVEQAIKIATDIIVEANRVSGSVQELCVDAVYPRGGR